jgi:hypothetical protein
MSSEFREKSGGERHIHAQQHIMVLFMVFAEARMNKGETPLSGPL